MDEQQAAMSPGHGQPPVRRARRRATAWRAFEEGRFADAAATFAWLNAEDRLTDAELRALVELKRDLAGPVVAVDEIALALARNDGDLADPAAWMTEALDLLVAPSPHASDRGAAARRLLELAAELGDTEVWRVIAQPARQAALDRLLPDPLDRLDALEQLTFAPSELGLPAQAIDRIEALGHQLAADHVANRAAERLLHDLGRADAAYRVERARRQLRRPAEAATPEAEPPPSPLAGKTVVIAGGHPALRSLIARDLARDGIAETRQIPSAREGVRSGRDVDAMLHGADVAVLLIRQIGHSTGDQVKAAARKANVPVVAADSAGTSGVRRALARAFAADSA